MRLRGLRTFTGLAAVAVVLGFCGATTPAHADTEPQATVQAVPDVDLRTTPLADGHVDDLAEPAVTTDDGAPKTPLNTTVTARRCPNSEVDLPLGPLADLAAQTSMLTQGQIDTYCRLSPHERAVCDEDLLKCVNVAQPAHDFAYQYDTSIGGPRTKNGDDRADAARHCLWQLYLTVNVDADYAARWGDAHEHSADPAQSHAMDLHNNTVARAASRSVVEEIAPTISAYPQGGPEVKKAMKAAVVATCDGLVQRAVHVKPVGDPHDQQDISVTDLEGTDICSPDNTLDNLMPCDISTRLVYIND
ncbi:hypothetical protein ABZ297_18280 [Nonomuraea sp. NPDC005983]|uniref:DUF6973 domain-containing protein n=1 Tax=Nonomuraea sp. NPDC005983 TaxID=3155595 RepID=UPI0033A1E75B